MKVTTVIVLLLLNYNRCLTIRVPVEWTQDSEVNKSEQIVNTEQNGEATQKPIYKDYFQYTAQKPQFAVDVAIAHDVQSPENLYKAHPVRPYTNLAKPVLGQHHILDSNRNEFQPYQKFVQKSESAGFITPATTSFEVFHPYKAEEPYLQQIYRDPVLSKIRNDLRDSKNRLQKYENEAGQTDVKGTEYLESLHETDRKKIPHKNIPTQFEMHRPPRRPIYYRPPFNHNHREHFLNNKLKSPWRTNVAKITPAHYRPIKHHLHGLRQQHAIKFDDERNEYPQALPPEEIADVPEGYNIYEKGKQKYKQIKNNAEELINKPENNRVVHPHLEPVIRDDTSGEDNDNNGDNDDSDEYDEDDFVPIKNYAQVRKTESTRHLPKQAAFHDAESLEEIKNAPRLREAIKSTKAQTVYSEEGYEDGAYDHGGEEKHASDHEGHGGYLKEHEISGGKYKIPTVIGSHEDEKAAAYRDQILDNNKWEESKKQTDDEEESDDYSEHEEEHSDDDYTHNNNENVENDRHKRDGETKFSNKNVTKNDNDLKNLTQQIVQDNRNKSHSNHDVIKRDTGPNVSQTSLPHGDMTLQKNKSPQVDNILFKYPYYNKEIKKLNKNSPFRYAENIKLIPKKTEGGTEFYDSRSNVHCPEVESDVDPIPDKIKKGGHPDENEEDYSEETGSKNINKSKKQRLSGLGDKIDCFKLKYFGENPLDSPFFKETKIENPEPIILQNVTDIFSVLDKLHTKNIKTSRFTNGEGNNNDTVITQSFGLTKTLPQTAPFYQKDIDRDFVSKNRKKRAAPFVYEPYKIIKDSQIQDSKKTTTTGNVSPLIKQLQSSRIIDKVSSVQDKNQGDKINSHSKLYKDISKEDRQNHTSDQSDSLPKFVDVSSDERRGEPRFEIKPSNHKTSYSPVESRRVMSTKDYESRKKGDRKDNVELNIHPRPVERNYFDVSQYLPQNMELQNLAASTAVKKVIRTTTSAPLLKQREEIPHSHENKEDYNEYEDEDEDEDEDEEDDDDDEENIEVKTTTTTTTSTTSTTQKPVLRKRSRGTTSPRTEIEKITESPKLKLVTRFHSPKPMKFTETKEKNDEQDDTHREYTPKYTELKKKSRARTLVTDTQVYGDNDDDTRKLEVDKLIGVKQDMDDYLPLYEKTKTERDYDKNKVKMHHDTDIRMDDRDDDNVGNEKDDDNEEIEEEDSDDDDDDDEEEDEEDDDEGELENDEDDEDESKKSHIEHHENNATPKNEGKTRFRLRITTPEPTKRTLLRTTVPPITTTVAHRDEIKMKPIILKKIEIHNEIPVIGSSPNTTQFKQDIKEIEIVRKNAPKTNRNVNKNLEALDLYRDDNLAKDINSLGGVDIFRENLNLESEPKHGGNYRSIHDEIHQTTTQTVKPTEDVETSESEHRKLLKLDDKPLRIRSRQKGNKGQSNSKGNEARSSKLIELSDSDAHSSKSLHGGNLRLSENRNSRRQNKNSKYIELEDEDDVKEEIEPVMHGGNFKDFGSRHQTSRGRGLHGGNYRSARIVDADKKQIKTQEDKSSKKENTNKAAELLDTYVRAVPILTTTPAYILDPSKRMYYYVDA